MRKVAVPLLSLSIVVGCRSLSKEEARTLAESAYYELKGHSLDSDTLRDVRLKIGKCKKANPGEAWAYIAEADLILDEGYLIGDRFDSSSYHPESLDSALDAALHAVELDSLNNTAAAVLARAYVIKGDNETAFALMRKVYERDPTDFYPPFILGHIYLKSENPAQAIPHLEQAERLAKLGFQKYAAKSALSDVYFQCGRPDDEERLDKELIRMDPDDAYSYESYGSFLVRQGRLNEAIANFRKGAALKPYPHILWLLDQTIRKSDSLSRNHI
jgi:tetratricopeptide (TPR) repeat protein